MKFKQEAPRLIKGNAYRDKRGVLRFNNEFDLLDVRRLYIIENSSMEIVRGWQGHKIERRWFSAIQGSFKIDLIAIENWLEPPKNSEKISFKLFSNTLDVLHVPKAYITRIQSLESNSKLLVMADYLIGELVDDYRYELDYFNI